MIGMEVDDNCPSLESTGQQLWGLMMEVIGTRFGEDDWPGSIPPDEVSEFSVMCIKIEYVFPPPFNQWEECETNWAKL